MCVLLVCRQFDLENDQRFRDLRAAEQTRSVTITVDRLVAEDVKRAVTHLGLPPDRLTKDQLELLRLPLHLALLAGAMEEAGDEAPGFTNPKDLFDVYWRHKRTLVSPLLSDPNNFELILDALCKEMGRTQNVSVPQGVTRKWTSDVDRLVSANILVAQAGRLAFFHEGFFDYVFARGFCASGDTLPDFLRAGDQDLFVRAQVRQILVYRRDQDFETYLNDVRASLSASDIRFHVKKLIVSVIGQTTAPTKDEWAILEACLESAEEGLAECARTAIWRSVPWLRFLYDAGVLAGWLTSLDDRLRNFAFNYVGQIAKEEPELVAELFTDLAGSSAEMDKQIVMVLTWSDGVKYSRALEDLFRAIISRNDTDWEFCHSALADFVESHNARGSAAACRALGFVRRIRELPQVQIGGSHQPIPNFAILAETWGW